MPSTASYRRATQESTPFERCFRTAKAECRPGLADGRMEEESFQPARLSRTEFANFHRLSRRTEAADPLWPRNHA
jgi:hypothetical protein